MKKDTRLLKECYELAAQYELPGPVREILKERAAGCESVRGDAAQSDAGGWQAVSGGQFFGDFPRTDSANPHSVMQEASAVMELLALDGYAASGDTGYAAEQKTAALSDCAEKEYLLALLALRVGRNETQRIEAMRHIGRAMDLAPGDPRYLTLAQILEQV